jgi:DNA-binding response OmpR family regulator
VRPDTDERELITYKNLQINYRSYEVTVDGGEVDLGTRQLKLLQFLSQHPGRVYTGDQLLDYIWGDETFVEPRVVDVHISNLRSTIEEDKKSRNTFSP